VAVQNLTEARQYLGLAQSAIANLLVSLATNKLNAWEKQTRLYGVRLYLERVETAIVWAIESASNGLRQHQLDGGPSLQPPPAPPRISSGAVSYRPAAPEPGSTPPISSQPIPPQKPTTPAGPDAPPASAAPPAAPPAPGEPAQPPTQPGKANQNTSPGATRPGLFGRLRKRKHPPTA